MKQALQRLVAGALVLGTPALAQLHVYDAGTAGNPAVPSSPEAQGWTLRDAGTNGLTAIANDAGLNAWGISDVSGPGQYEYAYYYLNTPSVTNSVIGGMWELTITMKPTAGPEANFFIEVNSGFTFIHTGYRVFFRISGDDVIVQTSSGNVQFTCTDAADGAYHTFSMRKVTNILYGDVQVLYDGAVLGTVAEDWPGTYAFDHGVKFGTWTDFGRARANVHRVEFRQLDDLGTPRCEPAVPNSTGVPATLSATGSPYVNQNLFELVARELPPGSVGYAIASRTAGFVPMAGGSQGNVCVSGNVGRFQQQAQAAHVDGTIRIAIDLSSIPGNPSSAVVPGDTWIFQVWYRDANPTSTSNFTHALDVEFR